VRTGLLVPGAQLFISDLHLTPHRPAINHAFFGFLRSEARSAQALYILGDLFDYWIGDDDLDDPFNASIAAGLRALAQSGCAVSFMPGNRDFLIGSRFAAAAGMRTLADPTLIDLAGTATLLLHGDTLCTGDIAYQEFRTKVHAEAWQQAFLARPIAERRAIALGLREESRIEQGSKSDAIMDVVPAAVETAFLAHGCTRMIHGHTHRPACHRHCMGASACERWVLGAWYVRGSYLRCDSRGQISAHMLDGQ